MNTSIAHLPAARQAVLRSIMRTVIRAVHPEKVLLLNAGPMPGSLPGEGWPEGSRVAACLGWSELLIITGRGERKSDHEIQDLVENRCQSRETLTFWIHDIDYVNCRLREGHYFFSLAARDAILLYDAGRIPLAEAAPPDLERILRIAQQDFIRWKSGAEAFYRSALFNQRTEPRLAAFLLHQAAEHVYQAILLAFTGYKPCTHNLDKLRRYTNRFSIELALLFPRDNDQEDHLFKLLLRGYVDARYKEEYRILESELEQLIHRVGKLLSIAGRVCHNRFISLAKMQQSPFGKTAASS